jgi:hypothetical protein
MKLLVYFTAYHWDNYQGGSGVYQNHTLIVEFNGEANLVWEKIHSECRNFLQKQRAFNQAVYTKTVGEYTINKAELI